MWVTELKSARLSVWGGNGWWLLEIIVLALAFMKMWDLRKSVILLQKFKVDLIYFCLWYLGKQILMLQYKIWVFFFYSTASIHLSGIGICTILWKEAINNVLIIWQIHFTSWSENMIEGQWNNYNKLKEWAAA